MPAKQLSNNVNKKEVTEKSLKYQQDKDREQVRGIFRFYEVPGAKMEFVFREYKQPTEKYVFFDGEMYTIPLGVARHLNKRGWYPKHAYALDENGIASQRIGQKIQRFGFQSLEFVDIDDHGAMGSQGIITVENI